MKKQIITVILILTSNTLAASPFLSAHIHTHQKAKFADSPSKIIVINQTKLPLTIAPFDEKSNETAAPTSPDFYHFTVNGGSTANFDWTSKDKDHIISVDAELDLKDASGDVIPACRFTASYGLYSTTVASMQGGSLPDTAIYYTSNQYHCEYDKTQAWGSAGNTVIRVVPGPIKSSAVHQKVNINNQTSGAKLQFAYLRIQGVKDKPSLDGVSLATGNEMSFDLQDRTMGADSIWFSIDLMSKIYNFVIYGEQNGKQQPACYIWFQKDYVDNKFRLEESGKVTNNTIYTCDVKENAKGEFDITVR